MTEQVVQEMCQEVARGTVATYQMDLVTDDIADSVIEEGINSNYNFWRSGLLQISIACVF